MVMGIASVFSVMSPHRNPRHHQSRRRRYCCTVALMTMAVMSSTSSSASGGGAWLASAAAAHDEDEGGSDHYQYQAHPDAHLYESVSATPLTFEPPVLETPSIDRARLLAEVSSGSSDGEGEADDDWIAEDFIGTGGEDGEEYYDDEEYFIPNDEYYDDFEMGEYHTEGGDYEMLEGGGGDEDEDEHLYANEEDNNYVTYDNEAVSRKLRRRLDNPVVEDKYLTKKDSFRDESIPIFEPELDENGKFEIQFEPEYEAGIVAPSASSSICGPDQQRATIRFDTDNYGHETSWKILRDNNGAPSTIVASGPPPGYRYADNRQYIGTLCFNPGRYRFEVHDKFNDGMCGARTGEGLYRLSLGDDDVSSIEKFASPSDCSINWGKRVHSFGVQAPPTSSSLSTQLHHNVTSTERELSGCSYVKVQFKIDKYGKETTVTLTGNGSTQLASRRAVGAYQTKTMQKCVQPGTYTLRLTDTDGICCSNGKGWYKMYVNGRLLVSGGYFIGSKTHTVRIGSNWQASMSYRDREWLNAHNARRRRYHGGNGYVPLRWSRTLAADAKVHANRLGNNCKNGALYHAGGVQDGENLAKNQGRGGWGRQYAADNVMGRWVEQELNWSYPKNAHYTQVVWRATQYVGCGESVRSYGNGYYCRVQVCRYIRPGNCGVRNGNWRAEAWKDDTQCGSCCPREGCFA